MRVVLHTLELEHCMDVVGFLQLWRRIVRKPWKGSACDMVSFWIYISSVFVP